MLITVKKQAEEKVEFKSPAYYKDTIGNLHYVNESGVLTTVRRRMICMWLPEDGKHYTDTIEELWIWGTECTKEEFDKAYIDVLTKMKNATAVQL